MNYYSAVPLRLWRMRIAAHFCAIILFLAVYPEGLASPVYRGIVPHNFGNDSLLPGQGYHHRGHRLADMEVDQQSFVQGGEKDVWIGLLDQEYVMQSSHALVLAFKKASKYIYSSGFIRYLFSSNPWLKYSIASLEEKLDIVKKLEKISNGSRLLYRDRPHSAAKFLANSLLTRLFPLNKRLFGEGRRQYRKHLHALTQALLEAKAGSETLNLIMASKTLPMYSWAESLFRHPIMTLSNTVVQAFDDAVGGVTGLLSSEVKNSCFSFAYRVNTIAPYTAIYPGGILGEITKGLVRSYFLVFQHTLVKFKGIFALLIGVICKTRIVEAAVSATKPVFRLARRGLRAVQAFKSKTIAMRHDPIGRGLMDRMMKRQAVVLISILFQLHAVDVEQQYKDADEIKSALSGPGGSWSLTEGLFVGALEFGRAFRRLLTKYQNSAAAYVQVCETFKSHPEDYGELQDNLKTEFQEIPGLNPNMQALIEESVEFFPEAHPEVSGGDDPLSIQEKLRILRRSCRKHARFVKTYPSRNLYYIQRVIVQMVRILRYYFKYFKSYIADVLSIFYETALAMLETKINDSIGAAEGVNSPADEMAAAEARFAARRAAAHAAIEEGQLPRKLFRTAKFAQESEKLAYGFFEAAGGLSLFALANGLVTGSQPEATEKAAIQLLNNSERLMRKGVGTIYQRFMNSQIILSRLENKRERLRIFELLAKCRTPLEEKTEEEKQSCGTLVTSEIDANEFIAKALFSLNLAVSLPQNDISLQHISGCERVFEVWAGYLYRSGQKNAHEVVTKALDDDSNESLIAHLRKAVFEKLVFRRFEHVPRSNKLMLYDESGRSLTFIGDDESKVKDLVAPTRDANGKRMPKPDPLDCTSRFKVEEENKGTLQFFLAAGQRSGEAGDAHATKVHIGGELQPAIELTGTIQYNDEREELASIQNDPSAIRDTISAHFVEKRGRVAAETTAGILMLLHSRLPIFWKHSPVEFIQHVTPKMFFDALLILSTQAYDQGDATVSLDGKLYTFPKSFTAIKDIVLSAVNKAIIRMHNLNASDAALLIAMGSVHFAYRKIQKHRTGRTSTMHLFLKEVNHIMSIFGATPDQLKVFYPECSIISQWEEPEVEDVLKCAVFRFMKIGSLNDIGDVQSEITTYVGAFVAKLAEMKGTESWESYLNLDYFLKASKIYGETAANYKYEVLYNQLNDVPKTPEEESELANLMKNLHPSLSTQRPPRPKNKKGFLTMLAKLSEQFPILPKLIRDRVVVEWKNCLARLKRFFGSRRSLFRGWKFSPKVIQGPHFMGALKHAEVTTYPDADIPRQVFIEVGDLEEFGRVLLTLEAVAATLDSPASMYNTVTQMRATPAFTPAAQDEHEKLIERARLLGPNTARVAAGWVLKTGGPSGVNMALGLLALLDKSGVYMDKALQLRYLSSEALAYLNSTLDLAYILEKLPPQTQAEVRSMRFNMHSTNKDAFVVRAQCEPKGLGVNTAESVNLADAIRRIEDLLAQIPGLPEGHDYYEKCTGLTESFIGESSSIPSIPHDVLLASDVVGMCYLLLRLRDNLAAQKEAVTTEDLLQSLYVDKRPLSEHLMFLQQRRADVDERKLRAKYISSMLRYLLIATVDNLSQNLGGISFRSYDGESKLLSFQYTLQEVSAPGRAAETLAFAADLLLSANKSRKERFVAFAFEGPHFLLEWYRYVFPQKLRELVDDARNMKVQVTYAEMHKLSSVYTVTDLSDLAYSLRQSSKTDAVKVAKLAALKLIDSQTEPALRRYGLARMLIDLVSQAEHVKRKCLRKALDDYENFSSATLLEKELFRYDCFYTEICESHAFADVAKSVSEEDIRAVMAAVDSAYEEEAKGLYQTLLNFDTDHTKVAGAAFKVAEKFPVVEMIDSLIPKFLSWVREKKPWQDVLPLLREEREATWVATRRTPKLGRPVTSLEHPLLRNPLQIIIDVMHAALSGSHKRRRLPVLEPVKRLKALYAMVKPGRKSRAPLMEDLEERQELAKEYIDRYNESYGVVSK